MKLQRWRKSATRYHIDIEPYCDDPKPVFRQERGTAKYPGIEIFMRAPCRKCDKCLQFRQLQWAERIGRELPLYDRTWFIVLTFDPVHLAGVIAESYSQPDYLTDAQKVERAAYEHVKLYLKRLRKSGGRFRYVAIPEYGSAEGRLHYHMLLHEVSEPITKRTIQGQWRSRISYAKLVKTKGGSFQAAALYISKYLTKELTRIRASQKYGKEKIDVNPTLLSFGTKVAKTK